MTQDILVPIDESEQSITALRRALDDFPKASITVLHVIDFRSGDTGPGGFGTTNAWEDWSTSAREQAEKLLSKAEAIAADYDHDITTTAVFGEDSSGILDYVNEHEVDRIYMGSHGRAGLSRVLLGSVAESIVRRAPVPVTVVR
jgi:nucleotide-binding universal stress UspA family protein